MAASRVQLIINSRDTETNKSSVYVTDTNLEEKLQDKWNLADHRVLTHSENIY